jgi:TolB protein
MRPDGQGLTRLTAGAGVTKDVPRWAPDTSRIIFQSARGKNYDMGIVRISDRRRTDLVSSSGYDGMYTWAPDGRHVAFISGRDGVDGLYTVAVSYTHIRAHETTLHLVCRLLL